MTPSPSARKRMPSWIDCGSVCAGTGGTTLSPQMLHGHSRSTITCTLAGGDWMLPLSSIARLMIVTSPLPVAVQLNVQFDRPEACAHVAPPLTDTSTAASALSSEAMPLMMSVSPL